MYSFPTYVNFAISDGKKSVDYVIVPFSWIFIFFAMFQNESMLFGEGNLERTANQPYATSDKN
ncbi:MAG TPA: hypothetical protein DEO65_14105 [Bacillus bacterium]|uniref:Uncharacterized protein n=1 Tax=Siminovitchia fordii TaxID=254759 RepID=A0ABQ4K8F3_9BACI|nr:hypothetical protein J1TS3_31480 [Siminovitchia fordii]HBZ10981.1 hypothetical protein [Bacillus sp. (in: firmicutes)]